MSSLRSYHIFAGVYDFNRFTGTQMGGGNTVHIDYQEFIYLVKKNSW